MSYITGTANNLTDLAAALGSVLVSEGFTLSGAVYSKGTLHTSATVVGDGLSIGSVLNLSVGNSVSGGVLGDFQSARIGPQAIAGSPTLTSWEWPVVYHIHANTSPTEVYMIVNYGAFWQMVSLGQSPSVGNPGTGNWVQGSLGANATNLGESALSIGPSGIQHNYYYSQNMSSCIPFFIMGVSGGTSVHTGSRIHGVYKNDGSVGWSHQLGGIGGEDGGCSSATPLVPLLSTQPNNWNLETTLLPCQVFQRRLEAKVSLVGEMSHLRITRNDYLPDGSVVTIGSDRWKIYPAYRRETSLRNGDTSRGINHSGTMAIALRYDGV